MFIVLPPQQQVMGPVNKTKNMKNKILFIFVLHLIIVACYVTITSWQFVKHPEPDPVATGLQQWLCVVVHFILTAIVCLVTRMKAVNKKAATTTLLLNLGAVVFWVIVNLLLSDILWDYLWSLRSK